MKKSILITLALIMNGLTTQAANPLAMNLEKTISNEGVLANFNSAPGASNDSNRFEQLLDLAHEGKPVSFSNVEGVYTGRCYEKGQNLARNSVLLILEVDTNPNSNSLSTKEKLVIQIGNGSAPADHFDSKTKEELIQALIPFKVYFSSLVENPLRIAIASAGSSVTFFKNQSSIVTLTHYTHNSTQTTVKTNDIWLACYYFNKK